MAGSAVIGNLAVNLTMETAAFEKGASLAEKRAGEVKKRFADWGASMTKLGAALSVGLTAPLALFGKGAFEAAMDAAELQSAFQETFGDLSDEMNRWAETTGNAMGRSTTELQKMSQSFGIFFNAAAPTREEAAKLSQQFTVLAQDLASFFNTSNDDAATALGSALRGESEPIRRYGVLLSDVALKAKAAELGLKAAKGGFTEQQKVMLRAAVIMEQTATAQGDVGRTADSTANQLRASQAAWEELNVTVGSKILPLLTPLISMLGGVLEKFNQLPPSVQTTAVGALAVAAALGPLMMGLGGLTTLAGAAIPIVTGWAASMGVASTAAGGLLPFLAPLLPVLAGVAAVASAAYLAWKNWDQIAPILEGFANSVREAVGPDIIALFQSLKDAVSELWRGPFGDLLRQAGEALKVAGSLFLNFNKVLLEVFGPVAIGAVKALLQVIRGFGEGTVALLNGIVAFFRGDWTRAWESLVTIVTTPLRVVLRTIESIAPGAIEAMRRLVDGVRAQIVDRLNAIWDGVKSRIDAVGEKFRWLYDVVVGHSYVPDLVDGIAYQMERLDAVLAEPVKKATDKAATALRELRDQGNALLAELFPEAAAGNEYASKVAFIQKNYEKLGLSAEHAAEAIRRLNIQFQDRVRTPEEYEDPATALKVPDLTVGDPAEAKRRLEEIAKNTLPEFSNAAANETAKVVESFARMAQDVTGSLDSFVYAVKNGDWIGALQSVLDIVQQVVGVIASFRSGGSAPASVPEFGGFRAFGGPVVPGKTYMVGERGPEWFTPRSRGYVSPSNDNSGPAFHFDLRGSVLTQDLLQQMNSMADNAAVRGSIGGAGLAQQQLARQRRRSLG